MTAGDARFVEIFERHYLQVYSYCLRRTNVDRVDDAVAEAFLTAWRKIDSVPAGEEALPWLYSVAYRVLSHQWRSTSRSGNLNKKLSHLGVDSPTWPDDVLLVREESRQVLDALARLRPIDQEILRLAIWEELGYSEIASVLDVGV